MHIPMVEVPYCGHCQLAVEPDPSNNCCRACGQPTERRIPFCGNPSCRTTALPDDLGRHITCGKPLELRTRDQLPRSNNGNGAYPAPPRKPDQALNPPPPPTPSANHQEESCPSSFPTAGTANASSA